MYTIKQAAERTGIAIPTIRMWERRYGVVAPTRTPGGYRLYDEDSIARLAAMQYLVERDGWRPSQAADRIREATPSDLQELAANDRAHEPMSTEEVHVQASTAVEAIVDAARRLDLGAIDATLDETFAGQRFEPAMDSVVFPALRGIGDAWSRKELDVAREHAASETIRRRIAHYFDAAGRNAGGATIVIGLPAGSRHELGAFAFAVAARRAGMDVVYLGADVPLEAWRQTIHDTDAHAVVVAVVSRDDARRATDVIRELQDGDARLIAIGGPSADAIPVDLAALRLPDRIEDAVPRLLEAMSATAR